jgi:NAD(P)-dependent dehydrogenase (short-subunit alcohol dehydrogenase family)
MTSLIIVTGASRGIGAAIAHRLAVAGFYVGCISRTGALPEIDNLDAQVGARFVPVAADVSREEPLRTAIDKLVAQGPPIAGLVNNAGMHVESRSADMSLDEWRTVLEVNATSVVVASQAIYPHLKVCGGGLIVNIGSFFDKVGARRNLAYSASKAAVGAITRVLAVEWAPAKVRVVNVAPGFILTDLNRKEWEQGPLRDYIERRVPGGSPGSATGVAQVVAALFCMPSNFLTGETIYVDGAQSLVP